MAKLAVDYSKMVQAIRPYTAGFEASDGYDARRVNEWNSAQKASVTRYFKLVKSLSAKSTYIFRPRKKSNLIAARKATGVNDYKKLKVAIFQIPSAKSKVKITVKKSGQVSINVKKIHRDILLFEDYGIPINNIIIDPLDATDIILNETAGQYNYYTIIAGEFEVGFWESKSKGIPKFLFPDKIRKEIIKLVNAYNSDKFNPDDKNSSYYGNWLRGLTGYRFSDRKHLVDYQGELRKFRDFNAEVNKKIMRAKTAIKRWRKAIYKTSHLRKITPKTRQKRIDKIRAKIDNKSAYINDLITLKIKRSTGH